jgi:hypothetical protein
MPRKNYGGTEKNSINTLLAERQNALCLKR